MNTKRLTFVLWICVPAFLLMGCQSALAQQKAPSPMNQSLSIPKLQVQETMTNIRLASELANRARSAGTLSSDDLSWIERIISKSDTVPVVKAECLKPLGFLNPTTIQPDQRKAVLRILNKILVEKDEKQDPAGLAKMYSLLTIKKVGGGKELLPQVEMLTHDKREDVRDSAKGVAASLKHLP